VAAAITLLCCSAIAYRAAMNLWKERLIVIHPRTWYVKTAVAAAGLVVATGVAAAADALPGQADRGILTAEDHTGIELPATKDSHPTKGNHPGRGTGGNEVEAVEPEAGEGVGPVDNHGAEVSAVAHEDLATGRDHGQAVSEVARAGHGPGAGAPVETPNTGGTNTADEASDGANEVGAEHAAPQGGLGSGNAGEHGKP
jgi:hypothetical protein